MEIQVKENTNIAALFGIKPRVPDVKRPVSKHDRCHSLHILDTVLIQFEILSLLYSTKKGWVQATVTNGDSIVIITLTWNRQPSCG